tara:strand:- start:431 stop:637 length:207 start_codon:yes stop_codon:yes gene_type:complete
MSVIEERVDSLLTSWWDMDDRSEESWESFREELIRMNNEIYERGYTEGYSFCKNEERLVETAASTLSE